MEFADPAATRDAAIARYLMLLMGKVRFERVVERGGEKVDCVDVIAFMTVEMFECKLTMRRTMGIGWRHV